MRLEWRKDCKIEWGRSKINRNCIGDAGARALADALRMNSTLQRIDLEGNNIGYQGARDLADSPHI